MTHISDTKAASQMVGRIIDGVLVEVELVPAEKRVPSLAAVIRAKTAKGIKGCTGCALHQSCKSPVPYAYEGGGLGDVPPFVVVGEAPGPDEDWAGRPFIGKSGKLLRAMMKEAGLPEPAFVNVVSCFPNNGGRIREPSKAEIEACRGNLMRQLDVLDSPFVLLTGGKAVRAWRSDLTVTETRGQVFVWMGRWAVMPVTHPASLLRNPSDTRKSEMRGDLARFHDLISMGDDIDPLQRLGTQCIKCGGYVTHYDAEGVPWCMTHWNQYKTAVKKARQRLGKKDVLGQERLM